MKRIVLVLISVCLILSLCACNNTPENTTENTTENTLPAPAVISESERILLAAARETEPGFFEWKYKTITDSDTIEKIVSLINDSEKTLSSPSATNLEDMSSKQILFRIRLSDGSTVVVCGNNEIYINAYYTVNTDIAGELAQIYESTEAEEKDWK